MDIKSFMPEEKECLEHLRMLRWPGGMRCVFCGSEMVVKTGMLGIGYKEAFFMVKKLKRSLYTRRIYERLQGEVEIDEAYVKAGLKGKRGLRWEPRKRGLKSRGRGIYDTDKVPVVVTVARKSGRVRIQPNRNVKGRVVIRRYQRDVDPGTRQGFTLMTFPATMPC